MPPTMFDFWGVHYFNESRHQFIPFVFKFWWGLYERWLAIYKRVPPDEDSVGVNTWKFPDNSVPDRLGQIHIFRVSILWIW